MELQNFNSLFEIFATFTLAYVLIDELTENPFVSLISKKILRTDKKINDIHSGITNTLSGLKASVNNIDGLNLNNQTVQEGIPRMVSLLGSVETRYEQSFVELKSLIRKNYSTKVFVYLNFRGEIKKVEDFLGMCNYVKTEDVSIVDSSRN